MMNRSLVMVAGMFGLTAVVAGTFAAHGLEGGLDAGRLQTWEVAVRYQMFHALALLALGGMTGGLGRAGRVAGWCWTLGTVIFAGSLYLLVLSGRTWLGMITPIGGGLFVAGWVSLIVASRRAKAPAE